jgi:hypothetical protein
MLVVLYSTSWRNWEDSISSQLCYIPIDSIIGIHYWKHITTPHDRGVGKVEAPTDVPELLKRFRYKHSITQQEYIPHIDSPILPLYYKILSTRIALKNALELYPDMPSDQPILCMRPDLIIESFPTTVGPNEYISIWNTNHRQTCNPPEMGDAACLTTKGVLDKLLNVNIDDIYSSCKLMNNSIWYSEHFLYCLLQKLDIKMVFDHSIKLSLARGNGNIEKLTI